MKRYMHHLMQLFLLYTLRNRGTAHAGLGFLDSKSDALSIQLPCEAKRESAQDRPHTRQPRIEVTVYQDVGAICWLTQTTTLRSAAGDTGSVVWRSSVLLADFCLAHFYAGVHNAPLPPFHPKFQGQTVLELGAGTGVLPLCLFTDTSWAPPTARPIRWVATDRDVNVPLMRKNFAQLRTDAALVSAEELDWFDVERCAAKPDSYAMRQLLSSILAPFQHDGGSNGALVYPDLLVCTDCVYNPGLHSALLRTMDVLCGPQTVIWVVIQLREAENTRQFLSAWHETGRYTIYSLDDDVLPPMLRAQYAFWMAHRA